MTAFLRINNRTDIDLNSITIINHYLEEDGKTAQRSVVNTMSGNKYKFYHFDSFMLAEYCRTLRSHQAIRVKKSASFIEDLFICNCESINYTFDPLDAKITLATIHWPGGDVFPLTGDAARDCHQIALLSNSYRLNPAADAAQEYYCQRPNRKEQHPTFHPPGQPDRRPADHD
jgi:hypothetical protein